MKEKALVLIGGNSEIGNALAFGIANRQGTEKIIRISRKKSVSEFGNTIQVNSFEDAIDESLFENYEITAFVVAFGVLENGNDFLKDLEHNFDINVLQYLKNCEKAIDYIQTHQNTELHITSSVLADFSRDTIFAYSQSKAIMEASLLYMSRCSKEKKAKIFIWKLAFVKTKMNSQREESVISTNLKAIENAAAKNTHPGIHYLPKYAKYPSRILHHFPRIASKID